MSDMKCPYCNADQEVCHDDGQGYAEDELHHHECGECGKTFVFQTAISFDYTPLKADCLNDSPHKFKATNTSPKCATKMRCEDCDEERSPTEDEWKVILGDTVLSNDDQKWKEHNTSRAAQDAVLLIRFGLNSTGEVINKSALANKDGTLTGYLTIGKHKRSDEYVINRSKRK